jgi:RepB DNA-primase from phage plasmid
MQLDKFPLAPSIVINSGGGFHVYWVLDSAVDLQFDSLEFRDVLRRTARALNGDLAAAEGARVLRVPGTLNHKYDPPTLVTVTSHQDVRYSLHDFEFLSQEPEERPRAAGQNGHHDVTTEVEEDLVRIVQ